MIVKCSYIYNNNWKISLTLCWSSSSSNDERFWWWSRWLYFIIIPWESLFMLWRFFLLVWRLAFCSELRYDLMLSVDVLHCQRYSENSADPLEKRPILFLRYFADFLFLISQLLIFFLINTQQRKNQGIININLSLHHKKIFIQIKSVVLKKKLV